MRWGDFPNGDEKNWWRMADIGPCGPCSEIHFDRGAHLSEGPECIPDHSETCPRWLEIWNLVFMEFELQADGSLTPLPAPGVDTGMGLERLASVVQQVPTNYDTDLFTPIHARMRELLGHDPDAFEQERFSYQVIADHSRAVTFLIADDVLPSNEGRGYVLRRILRRAVRHGRLLGRREPFMAETAAVVIDVMSDAYPYLVEKRDEILATIAREEAQFARTLDAGTVQLEEALIPLTVGGGASSGAVPRTCRPTRRSCRRRRVPAARHLRLPGRPDRRAGGRVRRRHRPRRASTRRSPSSASGADRARRPSSRSTPSSRRSTARSRAASATPNSSATRRRPPRAGSSRSSATGWSSTS